MPVVVLGVSGSIAAYKAAELASQLVKEGIDVHPVLTVSAGHFVQPVTFRSLTGNPTPVNVFDEVYPGEIAHIHLAKIADLIAIVPASMNTIARIAHGFGDDMLSATVSASHAPVLLAPGMNTVMWENMATRRNIELLRERGYHFVEPQSGRLACRTEGKGKMADVETVLEAIHGLLYKTGALSGKKVLITAGPTREPIDPVRYISNRSSGKMGYAVAEAARALGAAVTVISGPTHIAAPTGVRTVHVETAQEMFEAAKVEFDSHDYFVGAAAVADFRPSTVSYHKIKKGLAANSLALEPTTDLLAELGRRKDQQILIGFAAETESLEQNARAKLQAKNLDWIVANDVSQPGAGFDGDTNIVEIFGKNGEHLSVPCVSKVEAANRLWKLVLSTL